MNTIRILREMTFNYFVKNPDVNVDEFMNAPIAVVKDFRSNDWRFCFRMSAMGPNPSNGSNKPKDKRINDLNKNL